MAPILVLLFSLISVGADTAPPKENSDELDPAIVQPVMECIQKSGIPWADVSQIFEGGEVPTEQKSLSFMGCFILKVFIKENQLDCDVFCNMTDQDIDDCNKNKGALMKCVGLQSPGSDEDFGKSFIKCGEKLMNQTAAN